MPPALRALLLDELRDTEDPEITPLTDREVHTPSPLLDLGDLHGAHRRSTCPQLKRSAAGALRAHSPPGYDAGRPDFRTQFASMTCSYAIRSIRSARRSNSSSRPPRAMTRLLAIKMTLYRPRRQRVVRARWTEAAQRGIQVAVLVELQARFEGTNNINLRVRWNRSACTWRMGCRD